MIYDPFWLFIFSVSLWVFIDGEFRSELRNFRKPHVWPKSKSPKIFGNFCRKVDQIKFCISILNMSSCHHFANLFWKFYFLNWLWNCVLLCFHIYDIYKDNILNKNKHFLKCWSFKELLWSLSLLEPSSKIIIWDSDLKIWRSRRLLLSKRLKDISGTRTKPFFLSLKSQRNQK